MIEEVTYDHSLEGGAKKPFRGEESAFLAERTATAKP